MTISKARWFAKKGLRALAATVPGNEGMRVLMYHGFGEACRDPFTIPLAVFEQQVSYVAKAGLSLNNSQIEQFIGGATQQRGIIISIDDGLASVPDALAILSRYDVGAMIFVIGKQVGQEGFMSWDELYRARRQGFVIGSHSMSHVLLARQAQSIKEMEIINSKAVIGQHVDASVDVFAYPFGTRHAFDQSTRQIIKDAGYRMAFTTQHGAIEGHCDSLQLPRIKVESGDSIRTFKSLCNGGLDKWRMIDAFPILQRPPNRPVSMHSTNFGSEASGTSPLRWVELWFKQIEHRRSAALATHFKSD